MLAISNLACRVDRSPALDVYDGMQLDAKLMTERRRWNVTEHRQRQ